MKKKNIVIFTLLGLAALLFVIALCYDHVKPKVVEFKADLDSLNVVLKEEPKPEPAKSLPPKKDDFPPEDLMDMLAKFETDRKFAHERNKSGDYNTYFVQGLMQTDFPRGCDHDHEYSNLKRVFFEYMDSEGRIWHVVFSKLVDNRWFLVALY